MKSLLLSFYFTLFVIISGAQAQNSSVEGLKKDLEIYKELFGNHEYDSLLYYVNPKLFNILPEEAFIEAIASLFETDEFTILVNDLKPTYIMDFLTIEDRLFSLVDYDFVMDMYFEEGFENDEERSFMLSMMNSSYGEDHVELLTEESIIRVTVPSTMFAEYIGDRWTFTSYDSTQQALLDALVGKEIQEKILSERYAKKEPDTE